MQAEAQEIVDDVRVDTAHMTSAEFAPRAETNRRTWQLRMLFERRDLWVGVFWDRKPDGLHVYLCPVPTVAVHAHLRA